ncbi:ABC transporter permease [Proteinivorax tanatarense]|uniref:ABC transporter permease n=1 Tax=Proteinivorax tanatarense TaxID=1260629 RepID=A0AAU7VL90_9FIRM
MGLLRFELKKIFKQKKLLWLLIVVCICTYGIYNHFINQQPNLQSSANIRDIYIPQVELNHNQLRTIKQGDNLSNNQKQQYQYTGEMLDYLRNWARAVERNRNEDALIYEQKFLAHLETYEELGGQPLDSFPNHKRELATERNAWLIEHELYYEDETIPHSPHLLLKESSIFLFSILSVVILILLFGNIVTKEKEEKTWLTLRTQPLINEKIMIMKFLALVIILLAFIIMVVIIGILIPSLLGEHELNLNYPQILLAEEDYVIISTTAYILRAAVYFTSVVLFVMAFCLALNGWAKNTYTVLAISSITLLIGYFLTDIYIPLQTIINPFYHLQLPMLEQPLDHISWGYPGVCLLWTILFVSLAAFKAEKQINLIYSSDRKIPFNNGNTSNTGGLLNVVRFELRKQCRKGLLLKTYVILTVLVLFGYAIFSQQAIQKEEQRIESMNRSITQIKNSFIPNLKQLSDSEEGTEKERLEETIEHYHIKMDKLNSAVDGYKAEDWAPIYGYEIFHLRFINGELDTGVLDTYWKEDHSQFSIDVSFAEQKWMAEKEIHPVFPNRPNPTVLHSNLRDEQKEDFLELHTRVDNSGLYLLYIYFRKYFYFLPMLMFLFLLGGGVAEEKGKRITLNFLKTQPVAEKKIYLSKFINGNIITLLSCLIIFLLVIIIATSLNRFGDWQYPVLHYDSISEAAVEDYTGQRVKLLDYTVGFHFINLGKYLIKSIILFSVVTMFLISLSIFLSLFTKRQVSVCASTVFISAVGYAITNSSKMAHLSPFTYLNIPKIINGEIATTLNNPSVNFRTGIAVLLTVTAVLVLAGYFISGRKNAVTNKNPITAELKSKSQ